MSAEVTGVVRNPAGEVVPNASVSLRDAATNRTRKTTNDADGIYRITALNVSTYDVRAEARSSKLDFAFEFFNLFNRPNVAAINQFFGSNSTPLSTYRTPILFNSSRQFRLSIDLEF